LLDDLSLIEHEHHIGATDGAQPMRDNEAGAALAAA